MNINTLGTDTIRPKYAHLHPDALEAKDSAEAAAELAVEHYVESWLDGSLHDDGETYTAPIEAMIDQLPERLGVMLEHYKAGRKTATWMCMESLLKELERQIRRNAA